MLRPRCEQRSGQQRLGRGLDDYYDEEYDDEQRAGAAGGEQPLDDDDGLARPGGGAAGAGGRGDLPHGPGRRSSSSGSGGHWATRSSWTPFACFLLLLLLGSHL